MAARRTVGLLFVCVLACRSGCLAVTRLEDWLAQHPERGGVAGGDNHGQHPGDARLHPHMGCLPVQEKFKELVPDSTDVLPESKIHDSEMEVCYHGAHHPNRKSCCNRHMERKYQHMAEKDFYAVVQSTSSYLKNLLTTNAAHYQDLFLTYLRAANNQTERLFNDIYKIPLRDQKGPVQNLFLDLQAYIQRREVNLHESVEVFFDDLFPLIYHNNINYLSSADMDEDYRECLVEIRQQLVPHPFGDLPARIAHQMSKSFGVARAFLEALHLGIETINTTDHVPLERACKRGITRMEYCAQCEEYTTQRPCKGFCHNVMRGCLVGLVAVDRRWAEFVDALELLTTNIRGVYDIEEVLRTFHSKVSEAIMHAMEVGYKFSHQVVEKCGHSQAAADKLGGDDQPKPTPTRGMVQQLEDPKRPAVTLRAKVAMLMRNLVSSKEFFRTLPDTLCSAERFSAGLNEPCWNGHDIAPYNKTVVPMTHDAQINNPEVVPLQQKSSTITSLVDKLIHVKKLLHGKVNLEMMQGDQAWQDPDNEYRGYRDRGSGGDGEYNYYTYPLDDDDGGYSGSGSGDRDLNTDPTVIRTKPDRRPGSNVRPITDTNGDITFGDEHNSKTQSPYLTTKPKGNANSHTGNGEAGAAPSTFASTHYAIVCIMSLALIWLNG